MPARTAGGFHIYAFKRGWAKKAEAIRALEESRVQRAGSYLAVLRQG